MYWYVYHYVLPCTHIRVRAAIARNLLLLLLILTMGILRLTMRFLNQFISVFRNGSPSVTPDLSLADAQKTHSFPMVNTPLNYLHLLLYNETFLPLQGRVLGGQGSI